MPTMTRTTWLLGALLPVLVVVVLVGGGVLYLDFWSPFKMQEEEEQRLVSPDGRYTAVLSYRDGLTFGYYHVMLERPALWPFRRSEEVTEVASEGLDGVAWSGPQTLIVRYSCPENEFVVREHQWRGVRIMYKRQ